MTTPRWLMLAALVVLNDPETVLAGAMLVVILGAGYLFWLGHQETQRYAENHPEWPGPR